jgi:autotransporter-associated beta strand protein
MVGAKLTILGESRIITAFTSTTQVTVNSAYSQNYSGVALGSWAVFSKAFEIKADSTIGYYDKTGTFVFGKRYDSNVYANNLLSSFSDSFYLTQNSFALNKDFVLQWTNAIQSTGGSRDVGIRRNNTGSLEIYNGITADGAVANRRDLLARNITGSNALFSGSLTVSGSSSFSGSVNIVSGSLTVASASLAVSGSLSINGVNITATGGFQQTFAAATTWTATHNLNTLYPVITVYNGSGQVILPTSITATDVNTTTVTFNTAVAGTVNIISGQLQQNIAISNPSAIALSLVLGG